MKLCQDFSCLMLQTLVPQIQTHALLTGSGSGQQGDDEGQAQSGDMSRYHRRPPQPHVQPVVPHPQPLSHGAVLHIRPHAVLLKEGPTSTCPGSAWGYLLPPERVESEPRRHASRTSCFIMGLKYKGGKQTGRAS